MHTLVEQEKWPPWEFPGDPVVRTQHFHCPKVKITQWSSTLCDPMDYTVHEILQARILEWVAFLFSRGSSLPRDRTQFSHIAGRFFTSWATREAQVLGIINRLKVGGSWKGGKALLQVQRVHRNLSTIVCSDVPVLSLRELLSEQGKGNLLRAESSSFAPGLIKPWVQFSVFSVL